jgi:diphthine-ammonia ligase
METLINLLQSQPYLIPTQINLFIQDISNFIEINNVYKKFFSINPPTRVCVESNLLSNSRILLDCHGVINPIYLETMHVQGFSFWAPANIG